MFKIYVCTTFSDGMYDELDGVEYPDKGEARAALEKALDDPLTGWDILDYCISEVKDE